MNDRLRCYLTGVLRVATFRRRRATRLTYSAMRALSPEIRRRPVFRYGSNESSTWFYLRSFKLTTVDHDERAYRRAASDVPDHRSFLGRTKGRYVNMLSKPYTVVVIEGIHAAECYARALQFAQSLIVVTDTHLPERRDMVNPEDGQITRFVGYGPASFHVTETTIIDRRGIRAIVAA